MHNNNVLLSLDSIVQGCCRKMASYYQQQVDDRAWPPVKATNFINLALIKGQTSWRQTVQKSVDEIVGGKAETSYQSMIGDDCIGTFTLLEGRPGSGKTVLMNKISCDWAKGEILKSSLVIFIPLRRLGAEPDRELATLIRVACRDLPQRYIERMVSDIEDTQGEGVVFVFDGFDEYVPSNREGRTAMEKKKKPWYGNIFRRKSRSDYVDPELEQEDDVLVTILKRKYLTKSTIFVTSRPAACTDVREYAKKRIEVLGFLKQQIFEYIHHYFSADEDENKAQQLEAHLNRHPNLMNMAYLPLHCAMLAFLYEGDTFLPETETEFYRHFTLSTLLRSIRRKLGSASKLKITSFDQLPPKEKITFDKVCKLAFNATVESKQVFTSTDIKKILKGTNSRHARKDVSDLGLIVADQYFMRYGLDDTYTFLHLTYQEYLAAVYIAGLNKSKRMQIIQMYKVEENLSIVWRFLCGMMDFSQFDANKMAIFESIIKATKDNLERFQCCFETQSILPCDYVIDSFKRQLEFDSINFTPSDCAAIGYTIKKSGFRSCLTLNECSFNSEGALSLLQNIGERHQLSLTIRYYKE